MSDNRKAYQEFMLDYESDYDKNPSNFEIWQAATEQSSKEIERLNALVAMQAEALYASKMFIRNGVALGFIRMPDDDCPDPAKDTLPTVENALSASSATVAKWEAEKLLPLRRQVAMRDWALKILIPLARGNVADNKFAPNSLTATQCEQAASVISEVNAQATAEAYEKELAAKVLEEFIKTLRALPSIGLSERQFGELERATKVKE